MTDIGKSELGKARERLRDAGFNLEQVMAIDRIARAHARSDLASASAGGGEAPNWAWDDEVKTYVRVAPAHAAPEAGGEKPETRIELRTGSEIEAERLARKSAAIPYAPGFLRDHAAVVKALRQKDERIAELAGETEPLRFSLRTAQARIAEKDRDLATLQATTVAAIRDAAALREATGKAKKAIEDRLYGIVYGDFDRGWNSASNMAIGALTAALSAPAISEGRESGSDLFPHRLTPEGGT